VFRFIRPGGIRDSIPALWLRVYVNLLAHVRPGTNALEVAFPNCVIDTGSHLSVLPEYIWSQFKPGVVRPLPFDPAMPQSLRSVSLGGGTYPYELGELRLRLLDRTGGTMDVTVVAQLIRDGGKFTAPMILGLRGGALDGRILRSQPDTAALHGQAWLLEDPRPT
jgi:hypothetical protein